MGWGNVLPQGHNLDKLGRGPLGFATYQISRLSRSYGFRQEDFYFFPITACKKLVIPGRGHFEPQGDNLN